MRVRAGVAQRTSTTATCADPDKLDDLTVTLGWPAVGLALVPLLSNTAHLSILNLTAPEYCSR